MKDKVRRYIERHQLLKPGDRVGVAVSGGPDSVALLRVLLELREELGLVLSVVHFNHQIRGAEAGADEQFVRDLAAKFGLECRVGSADVPTHARQHGMSMEQAARQLRHEFFSKVLRTATLNALATGHTQDDQAETVLMKFIRGAGTRGLAGIYPKKEICDEATGRASWIVRPMLKVRRAEAVEYLHSIGQPWCEDASNLDPRYTRNRVRHQLLPAIEEFNPAIREALAQAAELAREEERFWTDYLGSLTPRLVTVVPVPDDQTRTFYGGEGGGAGYGVEVGDAKPGTVAFRIDLSGLRKLPVAAQRRIVHTVADGFAALPIDFATVERILELAVSESGTKVPLWVDWEAQRSRSAIVLLRRGEDRRQYALPLPIPGEAAIPALGLRFKAILEDVQGGGSGYNLSRFLDPQSLASELIVRNWRPGDRFWPAHAKSPEKVKRLLQERHITGDERVLWPVIASGDAIVWLRGFGAGQPHLATGRRAVVIEEVPL